MIKLSELKKLHEKGLALIYLREKSKRPFESKWTSQSKKSWDELENSFEKSYNVGVRLGEPSHLPSGCYLGAIDCDVKSKSRKALKEMNEALRKLNIDLQSAPVVMSGRGNGSKHIYVQTTTPMKPLKYAQSEHKVKVEMPGETKPYSEKEKGLLTPEEMKRGVRIRAAWEISFMGTGQQTVLPPSVHPDTGWEYQWASPLTVKHTPVFDPEKFTAQKTTLYNALQAPLEGLDFKAEDVDLYASSLSVPFIKMIESGEGCEDRSASLFSIGLAMCRQGFTDNQILSVLSNPNHWIAEAAYEHTQSRDRLRAVKWLYKYTLMKARYETDIMRRFENKPDLKRLDKKEARLQVKEIEAERNTTLPDLDGQGKPKPTVRNIIHVLEHFLGGGLVGYDAFSNRYRFLKDNPYGGEKGKELTDTDDLKLQQYLASHYRFEPSTDNCLKAYSFVAHKYQLHPVKTYLEKLVWDKTPRLDTWLEVAFGAVGPDEYIEAVSRKVLVAAVTRVFEPGCKFDYVLVLEGNQGEGKSMALGILASQPWFTDGLGDIHNKDVVDQMTGKWIIELSELTSIRGRENEAVKAFLSRQIDRVRQPFGRRSMDFPRQNIFIGSTNNSEYLSDETGNRRYWPVKTNQVNRKWIRENRDQLWAEAMVRYELGETIYLSKEIEELAKHEQDKRFETDEWEKEVRKIVKSSEKMKQHFTITEVWRAMHLNDGDGHPSISEAKRIGKILRRLKFIRVSKRIEGSVCRVWVKNALESLK